MVICHATSLCSQSHHIHFCLGKLQKMSFSWRSTVPLLKFLLFFVGLLSSCPVTEILVFSCMWCSGLDLLNCLGLECVYSNCIMLHPIVNSRGLCTSKLHSDYDTVQKDDCTFAIILIISLCSILHNKRTVLQNIQENNHHNNMQLCLQWLQKVCFIVT